MTFLLGNIDGWLIAYGAICIGVILGVYQATDRGKRWYFYGSDTVIYFAMFDPERDKIPARFHGPYDDKQEAREAYFEWLEGQQEREDAYEYTE